MRGIEAAPVVDIIAGAAFYVLKSSGCMIPNFLVTSSFY